MALVPLVQLKGEYESLLGPEGPLYCFIPFNLTYFRSLHA